MIRFAAIGLLLLPLTFIQVRLLIVTAIVIRIHPPTLFTFQWIWFWFRKWFFGETSQKEYLSKCNFLFIFIRNPRIIGIRCLYKNFAVNYIQYWRFCAIAIAWHIVCRTYYLWTTLWIWQSCVTGHRMTRSHRLKDGTSNITESKRLQHIVEGQTKTNVPDRIKRLCTMHAHFHTSTFVYVQFSCRILDGRCFFGGMRICKCYRWWLDFAACFRSEWQRFPWPWCHSPGQYRKWIAFYSGTSNIRFASYTDINKYDNEQLLSSSRFHSFLLLFLI